MSAITNYVTVGQFTSPFVGTGYTEAAIREKIKSGVWKKNEQYIYAPDNRLLISISGFHKWVEKQNTSESAQSQKVVSKSRSNTKAQGNANGSTRSPQMPTFS